MGLIDQSIKDLTHFSSKFSFNVVFQVLIIIVFNIIAHP